MRALTSKKNSHPVDLRWLLDNVCNGDFFYGSFCATAKSLKAFT